MHRFSASSFFASPHFFVLALLAANVVQFLLCAQARDNPVIATSVLVDNGALTSPTLERHEYWRFLTYGFLHANPTHLLMNMISLLIVAPHLERRLGTSYFVLIYAFSIIGAGVVSAFARPGPFVTVGASGGLFGILAALFALWILGESDLSPTFFLINFSLNFVFATRTPNVDWAAHFGGFAAGFTSCALLDLLEKTNALRLRCKFPEFVKFNALALIGAFAAWLLLSPPPALEAMSSWATPVGALVAGLVFLHLLDHMLVRRKGLAFAGFVLASCNAVTLYAALCAAGSACQRSWTPGGLLDEAWRAVCAHHELLPPIGAICAIALTVACNARDLRRGLADKGFVAPTLIAERKRRRGL